MLGAEPIEHAATPGVRFHLHAGEPEGREVYAIALSTQIQIDPARRAVRRRDARAAGRAVRRARALGRDDALVPVGARRVARPVVQRLDDVHRRGAVHVRPRGRLGEVLRLAAGRRRCRSASTSTAPCSTAATTDRLQVVLVPWSCTTRWRMPVEVWRRTIDRALPGRRLDPPAARRRSTRSRGARRERGLHSFDDTVRELL